MTSADTLACYLVNRDSTGEIQAACMDCVPGDLPEGNVRVQVQWSSLNYKDALAATGHPGVVRSFPHVPGIDAAGVVLESEDPRWNPGAEVVVTGCNLGAGTWGGWAQQIRVPGDWLIARPQELSLRDCMIYGTAGMTAVACVEALQHHGIDPDGEGEILVTGATGGVGSISVMLLKQLGYQVVALTGKPGQAELLQQWGAVRVLSREDWQDDSDKPLLRGQWRGGIDVAGGATLSQLLRETVSQGTVAACGMVGGADLPVTVYPFILRGVTLAGIDSVGTDHATKTRYWDLLAGRWKLDWPTGYVQETKLAEIPGQVKKMLAAETVGRILVKIPG
ncbi:MAG: YhdH/YhfP family quinone oxidoreductase [Pirellulaceae bacterium]|nr:YhdH/YhfP family quinone oxidoreductase [Pirellulaceae bacterium]